MSLSWSLRELVAVFAVELQHDDPLCLRVEVYCDTNDPKRFTVSLRRWDLYRIQPRFSSDGGPADEGVFVDFAFPEPFPREFRAESTEEARRHVLSAIETKMIELGGTPVIRT